MIYFLFTSPDSLGNAKPNTAIIEIITHGKIKVKRKYNVLLLKLTLYVTSAYVSSQQSNFLTLLLAFTPSINSNNNYSSSN